jgi:hypothetical protein
MDRWGDQQSLVGLTARVALVEVEVKMWQALLTDLDTRRRFGAFISPRPANWWSSATTVVHMAGGWLSAELRE